MLCAGDKSAVDKSLCIRHAQVLDDLEVRAVALVGTSPARVNGLSNAGSKVPEHMTELCLIGCDKSGLIHECLVVRGSKTDIMREDNSSRAVIHAVNVVLTVDERYAGRRINCALLIALDSLTPLLGVVIVLLREDSAVIVELHILL